MFEQYKPQATSTQVQLLNQWKNWESIKVLATASSLFLIELIHIYNKNYQHICLYIYRNCITFFLSLYYVVSSWNASTNFSCSHFLFALCVFLHVRLPQFQLVNMWQFEKFVYVYLCIHTAMKYTI